MKAILLAGGKGTRLRPLTLHTPKPIVPILNRPFLYYQIDLLKQIPEIDEVILSLNYQPRRIEEIFGEGEGLGVRVRYVVEPMPLGTGGAQRRKCNEAVLRPEYARERFSNPASPAPLGRIRKPLVTSGTQH